MNVEARERRDEGGRRETGLSGLFGLSGRSSELERLERQDRQSGDRLEELITSKAARGAGNGGHV